MREPSERGPAALLPAWAARLVGFAALACLGASQWQRMVESGAQPLLWVAIAVAAAVAVLACDRVSEEWRSAATLGAAGAALLATYLAAGLSLRLLGPRRLDELGAGLTQGTQALSSVRLPYQGADPWPGIVLELLGAGLVTVAALLAFWPRGSAGRGYPFLSLAALLVLVATPVVALGGTRPLLLGMTLMLLTVCFLWLERLPLRPGLGVAALVGLVLAGALPLASAADRGEPWFDYQAFAEGLGPKDPVRFDWGHGSYGPIAWSRDGTEVMRVRSQEPHYWKVQTLDRFDGLSWDAGSDAGDESDLPDDPRVRDRFQATIQVSVQRLRGSFVPGAGTTLDVFDETRRIVRGERPGDWQSISELRSGDSYGARVFVPRPSPAELSAVRATQYSSHEEELELDVNLDRLSPRERRRLGVAASLALEQSYIDGARVRFPPFGAVGVNPTADFGFYGGLLDAGGVLQASQLRRTWGLAQRLKRGASTPHEYVLAVGEHLREGFSYTERPPAPPPGTPPLEWFLHRSRAGYCQHYSAAMALLLRMGGVPARVATGFSPGGLSKRRQAWVVRDTDAHSWVEAWFEDYGWVTFDPTPPATPARSQIAAVTPTDEADEAGIPDATGGDRVGGGASAGGPGGTGGLDGGAAAEDGAGEGGGLPWPLAALATLGVAGGAVLALRRRRLRTGDPIDRALAELEAALRRSGRRAPPRATLAQVEQRLGLSGDAAGYVRAISECRYGRRSKTPTNAQRRAFRRQLSIGRRPLERLRTLFGLPPRLRPPA